MSNLTLQEVGLADPAIQEALLCIQGYTMSIANKAVLSRFGGHYVMRSGDHRVTLPEFETTIEQLIDAWRSFRLAALLPNET